jgi:aminoglycoside phosphotransferase (APT) family kinase protein
MEPGTLLATGRAADVYDQGDGTVLRRYRIAQDVAGEARLMTWLADHDYPVPGVHHADGADLVMARILGPTMLEDFQRRPWRLVRHAYVLARLQRRLNSLLAPDWLGSKAGVPPGDRVLHLDLHPMNVMLTSEGPVVIDWTNAIRGDGWFDAAISSVVMSTAELSGWRDRLGARVFVLAFELFRGRRRTRRSILAAATFRLADPNITDLERSRLRRLVS